MRSPGFSLVECVIAMLVLSAGVISVAASTAAIQRLSLLAWDTNGATRSAASRFDSLALSVCAAPAGGVAPGRYQQQWTVVAGGTLRQASLAVTVPSPGAPRIMRFAATYLCRP
jgi:Tfp pilus assembly protein PilV